MALRAHLDRAGVAAALVRARAGAGIRAWLARVSTEAVRSRRVSVLVLSFVVLGVADLTLTLAYMHTVGLFEGNPLARALAHNGGSAVLAGFKLATIALSSVILFALRAKRSAEMGAWVCVLAMFLVSLEWGKYASASDEVVLALQIVDSPFGPKDHFISLRR